MQNPIIVLIDAENRAVRLYGKYNRIVPFSYAFILPSLLNGERVLYVTSVEEVQGEDVIDVLAQIVTEQDYPQEKLYIRSKQDGYIRIPEIKGLVFSGPKDAKPVETIGWDLFDRSNALRKLLIQDKVEIMLESEAKALRKYKIDPKSKDKSLDSIILDRPVMDIIDSEDMFGPGEGDGDEVPTDENEEVLSENEMILKQNRQFGKDRQQDA